MKWFKHDSDANQDAKLSKLIIKYGSDGYALYWYCLELISGKIDKNNYTFELEHDAELLAYKFKIDTIRVEEIMKYMVSLDLFSINTSNNRIVCLKLATRLDDSTGKNPELREALCNAKEQGIIKVNRQYVYIFQDKGKYKIGKTNNLERRFSDAKNLNNNISIFHFIETPDASFLEASLHRYFSDKNIEGEWFSLDENDLKIILSVKKIDDVPKSKIIPNRSEQIRLDEIRIKEIRSEENKQEEIRIKDKSNVCFISDDKIEIPDKENETTESDVSKNQSGGEIDEIYKLYPGKCPVSSRVTGKSSKDRDKIKKILKTISYQELKETINLYLEECIKTKTYIKNFDTFLNNLPDLNDLKLKSPRDETKEERALRIAKLAFGDIVKNERETKSEVIYE